MRHPVPISRRTSLALGGAAFGLLVAACSSGTSEPSSGAVATTTGAAATARASAAPARVADAQAFSPVIASSELAVGQNRFALGIIENSTKEPLPDAKVRFRFFTLVGNQGTLRSEADARFASPARDAGPDAASHNQHGSGTDFGDVGVYVSQSTFEEAGKWAVEATFTTKDNRTGKVTAPFEVLAASVTPAVGTAAPRTRNLTARDVKDLSEIDSAAKPVPALHQTTIADAISAGKPVLVGFLTPGFCETRFCGPSYELMQKLMPTYGDKAALIHVEVYKDGVKRVLADAVTEWNIRSEPYFFVIDRNGVITAKFEGPVSLAELDAALKQVTS